MQADKHTLISHSARAWLIAAGLASTLLLSLTANADDGNGAVEILVSAAIGYAVVDAIGGFDDDDKRRHRHDRHRHDRDDYRDYRYRDRYRDHRHRDHRYRDSRHYHHEHWVRHDHRHKARGYCKKHRRYNASHRSAHYQAAHWQVRHSDHGRKHRHHRAYH